MDPNAQPTSTPPPEGSKSNAFLALISVFILLGVVGITLFLYLQNKSSRPLLSSDNKPSGDRETGQIASTPTPNFNKKPEQLLADHGVVCKRFTSLEQALKNPEIACVVDLSDQKLTKVPESVLELKNISELDLSNNQLTEFPVEILELKKIAQIDLSDNNIIKVIFVSDREKKDEAGQKYSLQIIKLDNNKLSQENQKKIKDYFGSSVSISF